MRLAAYARTDAITHRGVARFRKRLHGDRRLDRGDRRLDRGGRRLRRGCACERKPHTRNGERAFGRCGRHDRRCSLECVEHKPTNDRAHPVTKFCLAMEVHRRTPEGRVRTEKDLVAHFFPHEGGEPDDRLFRHMPNEVRGPILTAWGIRGSNSARRDDDAKVRTVVHDALVAGDIDEAKFEEGVTPGLLVDWIALSDWWTFWRKGKLTGVAIRKALATARELGLIDDEWFFDHLEGRGGKLKGTDVVCDTLTKDQVVAWLKNVHASGDGSPAGLVAAIGWETVLSKTAEDALLFALDAFAKKAGLLADPEAAKEVVKEVVKEEAKAAAKEAPAALAPEPEPAPPDPNPATSTAKIHKIELSVAETASPIEESPKLAEARAQMLKMLNQPAPAPRKAWEESDVPGRPSSLEWPEPPVPTDVGSVDIIPVVEDDSVPVMQAAAPVAAPVAPPPVKAKPAPAVPAKKAPMPRTR